MILSATLSKPGKNCAELLGQAYLRIRIKPAGNSSEQTYFAEFFTATQAFHKMLSGKEVEEFLKRHAGTTFLNCTYRTETEEITILGSRKGHTTRLVRKLAQPSQTGSTETILYTPYENGEQTGTGSIRVNSMDRVKNYILPEGVPVPFLVYLGVMTPAGKVVAAKYDKFRQINRFLEYIDDVLPDVIRKISEESGLPDCSAEEILSRPLRIADFGCGKSYLTFAVYYYLTKIKKIPAEITGLDLKTDVITYCNRLAEKFGCTGLRFAVGDIAGYKYEHAPDMVITLHACDTATDYALGYAARQKTKAILSVPCCQHELNRQIEAAKPETEAPEFATLFRYGIIRERFSALATDALRAEYLEAAGYSVQILEFIDMAHTPKNLLIRAVLREPAGSTAALSAGQAGAAARSRAECLTDSLRVSPTLRGLLPD
jgi:SAM-dependent methyltransferase